MRSRRPFERGPENPRDTRLLVLATEDTHAVKQYFDFFNCSRVKIISLPSETDSSPQQVLQRLDEFKASHTWNDDDEFWLVIDSDHWVSGRHAANLSEVFSLCSQKGYKIALSNPCFEFWLMLHFAEPPAQNISCKEAERILREQSGGYNKAKVYNLSIQMERVRDAVARAKAGFTTVENLWNENGSNMFEIVETLLALSATISDDHE